MPLNLKIASYSYALILLLEGIGSVVGASMPSQTYKPWPAVDSGAWTIFVGALIVTDSFAIYLRTPVFYVAAAVKMFYPLYNASRLIMALSCGLHSDIGKAWSMIRLLFTVTWLYSLARSYCALPEQDGSHLTEVGVEYNYSEGSEPSEYREN